MTLARRLVAEGIGTALLIVVVVGSGIMAERLCRRDAVAYVVVQVLGLAAAAATLLFAWLMPAPVSLPAASRSTS